MTEKAPKEKMPALIAEISTRSNNIKHMKSLQGFVNRISVMGSEAIEFGMALNWLNTVIVGEEARCAEIKSMLPDKDTEIDLTKPEEPKPAVSQGTVEMSKGEEVLQPA